MLVLAIFLFGALAYAGSPKIEGTVQKIDKNSITVQVGSEQQTFTFDRELRITFNGKRTHEMSIKPGDKATIVAGKNNVAEKLDITPQSGSSTGSSN
jgi:hypothetical protein